MHTAGPIREVLTAENLSDAFGVPLLVAHGGGRWMARAARADLRTGAPGACTTGGNSVKYT